MTVFRARVKLIWKILTSKIVFNCYIRNDFLFFLFRNAIYLNFSCKKCREPFIHNLFLDEIKFSRNMQSFLICIVEQTCVIIFNNDCQRQTFRNSSFRHVYKIGTLTHDHPRMLRRRVVYENGLLTYDHEFSSSVFGGVSTCGDSDGLRTRAPRCSPVREERSDAKDVGKIDSLSQARLLLHFSPQRPPRNWARNRLRRSPQTRKHVETRLWIDWKICEMLTRDLFSTRDSNYRSNVNVSWIIGDPWIRERDLLNMKL